MYHATSLRFVAPVALGLALVVPPALAAERIVLAENFVITW